MFVNLTVIIVGGIIVVVIIISIIWFIFYFRSIRLVLEQYRRRQMDLQERLFKSQIRAESIIDKETSFTGKTALEMIEDIINDKKQKFINLANVTFYYVDKQEIENSYNDYFHVPELDTITREKAGETGGNIGAKVQFLEAGLEKKGSSKEVSTFKSHDISDSAKFLRFQKEIIQKDQVILGIEEVSVEETELKAFEEIVDSLNKRFGLEIAADQINKRKTYLMGKASEKALDRLQGVAGLVLVEGSFEIKKDEPYYICVYSHPVNKHLPEGVGPITISARVLGTELEPRAQGNFASSVGKKVPFKIYGKVWSSINKDDKTWDLAITPIAIY